MNFSGVVIDWRAEYDRSDKLSWIVELGLDLASFSPNPRMSWIANEWTGDECFTGGRISLRERDRQNVTSRSIVKCFGSTLWWLDGFFSPRRLFNVMNLGSSILWLKYCSNLFYRWFLIISHCLALRNSAEEIEQSIVTCQSQITWTSLSTQFIMSRLLLATLYSKCL